MKTYTALIAYHVTAYATVEIEAESPAHIAETIRDHAANRNFRPLEGNVWDTPADIDWSGEMDHRICDIADEGGDTIIDGIDLCRDDKPWEIIDAQKLARILNEEGVE